MLERDRWIRFAWFGITFPADGWLLNNNIRLIGLIYSFLALRSTRCLRTLQLSMLLLRERFWVGWREDGIEIAKNKHAVILKNNNRVMVNNNTIHNYYFVLQAYPDIDRRRSRDKRRTRTMVSYNEKILKIV